MKKINLKLGKLVALLLAMGVVVSSCKKDDEEIVESEPMHGDFTVGAEVNGEEYLTMTYDLLNGKISIVGNGIEGAWGGQSISKDGYLYIINGDENTIEKYDATCEGLKKMGSISLSSLIPGGFFRYTRQTKDGDLFLSNFPDENGLAPFAIIDMGPFTVKNSGTFQLPEVNGRHALWINTLVKDDKAYISTVYGSEPGDPGWGDLADSLITVVYDYPSMINPEVIVSTASSGMVGYRTDCAFLTENGDIYQHNLTSAQWNTDPDVVSSPTVFVKIKDGDYDDSYVFDVSAKYTEDICIWNAWYAGNGIVYANITKESDLAEWADLSANTGTLTEINLYDETVTPLNIPMAPYVNIFQLNCIQDGKFYAPVCISGGDANIYEVEIGGGANGFTKGAKLDGSNVYVNSLQRNY